MDNVGKIYEPKITVNSKELTNSNGASLTLSSAVNEAMSFSPESASPVLSTTLTVNLNQNFPAENVVEDKFKVTVTMKDDDTVSKKLNVYEVDSDNKLIKVMFNGAESGTYTMSIHHDDLG